MSSEWKPGDPSRRYADAQINELALKLQTLLTKFESEFGSPTERGHIKESLDSFNAIIAKLEVKVGAQNGRIGKLENWKSYILGVGGTCGGIVAVVALLVDWIKH